MATPSFTKAKRPAKPQPSAKPRPPAVIDPETLDDVYCLVTDGNCLEPLIPHGASIVFKKSEKFAVGDIVVIWFGPDVALPAGPRCWVKRLTMGIPSFVQFPFRDAPGSELSPVFSVEQFQPPRRFTIPCEKVLAIHKAIGRVPAGKIGEDVDMAKIKMIPIGAKQPAMA